MNTGNSAGVISAWEPGINGFYAWANPVVREAQSVAALNLHTINQLNGDVLKTISMLGNTRTAVEWMAIQWNAANSAATLMAGYGNELRGIVARLNEALQEVGQAQAKKNDIHVRSVVDAFHSRTQAAASAVTSAVATVLSTAATPEALARQQTDDAIARAASAAQTRSLKAVID